MQIHLDCLPCLLRQALAAARQASDDEEIHRAVVQRVLDVFRLVDVSSSPPHIAQKIHRIIRAALGEEDPFQHVKRRMNLLGLALRRRLFAPIAAAADPFAAAARAAIAGNCIDYATRSRLTEEEAGTFIAQALHRPLVGSADALENAAADAQRILYLADNAGEIALDHLLLERLPRGRVTMAVRGHPVINDATLEDAEAVQIPALARVMDNGSDAPGTLLDNCSPDFQRAFAEADLIIAKGQGNFESLAGRCDPRIHFLLIPKCPLVAAHVGAPEDTLVIWSLPGGRPEACQTLRRTPSSPRNRRRQSAR